MSPIDDELRAALHGRAQVLAPSPDPLVGVERRATRIQRTRVGAAVLGSALAVALVALVVPAIQTATSSQPEVAPFATSAPSAQPMPGSVSYALDSENPWAFRGEPVEEGARATIQEEYATRVQGAETLVTPLFAQVYEPSAQLEVVFLAEVDGAYRWGVAAVSESGAEFRWDEELLDGQASLAAALPGDEGVSRLLIVASPEATGIEYGPNDATEFSAMTELADGVAITPLEGDPATDVYRVTWPGESFSTTAPDLPEDDQPAGQPANLLVGWDFRGDRAAGPPDSAVLDAFAQAVQDLEPAGQPQFRALFSGSSGTGLSYVVGQAWVPGRDAYTVGLTTGGESGPELFLGPVTDPEAQVLAFVICCSPGPSTDMLIVVPEPGTGQVLYAKDADTEFVPVGEGQDNLDGVVLIDRDPRALSDRIQLLDGDGDLDNPSFTGDVTRLLCGLRDCD